MFPKWTFEPQILPRIQQASNCSETKTTKGVEKSMLSLKDHDHDMVRGFLWDPLRNEDEKSTFQF